MNLPFIFFELASVHRYPSDRTPPCALLGPSRSPQLASAPSPCQFIAAPAGVAVVHSPSRRRRFQEERCLLPCFYHRAALICSSRTTTRTGQPSRPPFLLLFPSIFFLSHLLSLFLSLPSSSLHGSISFLYFSSITRPLSPSVFSLFSLTHRSLSLFLSLSLSLRSFLAEKWPPICGVLKPMNRPLFFSLSLAENGLSLSFSISFFSSLILISNTAPLLSLLVGIYGC